MSLAEPYTPLHSFLLPASGGIAPELLRIFTLVIRPHLDLLNLLANAAATGRERPLAQAIVRNPNGLWMAGS